MPRAAAVAGLLLALACLPTTVMRLQGGTAGAVPALLAALVPWTVPVLALAVVLGVVGLRTATRLPVVAVGLAAVLLVVHAAWVAPSVLPGPVAATSGGAGPGAQVRVLALNLEFGAADADEVVDLVRRERVDVLAAVEVTPDAVRRLRAAGLERELPASVVEPEPWAAGSALWSRHPVQALASVAGTSYRTPRARVLLPGGRRVEVTAVHPPPPMDPAAWARDLGLVADAVRAGDGVQVVAGDFNATRDHAPFRRLLAVGGLADAADVAGVTGVLAGAWPGLTWPADRAFPPVLRLDHVLVSRAALAASRVSTVRVRGTDHRGVLAVVTLT